MGAARDAGTFRTLSVVCGMLRRLGRFDGQRLLDVGCGTGAFTVELGKPFEEVVGVDVQTNYLDAFRARAAGDPRFRVLEMAAERLDFPDEYFDTIVSIETLEHVTDPNQAAAEMARVLKPGGELLITAPNRLFPFENHGVRIGGRVWHGRVPLLPYIPLLHDKFSVARVFTASSLKRLFVPLGLFHKRSAWLWPTFEHGGNALQPLLRPMFGLMRAMERSPLRMFGSSVVCVFEKPS